MDKTQETMLRVKAEQAAARKAAMEAERASIRAQILADQARREGR